MATATHLPDGERFERTGLGGTGQAVLGIVGAVGFFAFTVVILMQGFPTALMALLTGFFGAFLGLGAVASLLRNDDPTVIEVSGWGVWLPDLGAQPWSAFRSVRLEHFIGPAGNRTTTYRRLGLEPLDPRAGERRPFLERVTFDMGTAYFRFVYFLMARRGGGFAPYGVHETEIGVAAFDRLVAAVSAHVTLQRVGDVPGPTATGGGAGGVAPSQDVGLRNAGLLGAAIPAAFGGFVLMVVAGILSGPGWRDGDALPFALAFVGIAVVVVGGSLLQAARRARRAGAGLLPIAIVALASAAGGIVAALVLGFGPR